MIFASCVVYFRTLSDSVRGSWKLRFQFQKNGDSGFVHNLVEAHEAVKVSGSGRKTAKRGENSVERRSTVEQISFFKKRIFRSLRGFRVIKGIRQLFWLINWD